MSPRRFAKSVLHHARCAQIRTLAAPRAWPWLRHQLHLPANETFEPLRDPPPDGSRLTVLDPGGTFHRPLPVLSAGAEAARAFFAARQVEVTGPSYVAEFAHGVAWGHPTGGVFTADGRFAPAFTHDPSGPRFHAVWTRLRLPTPRRLRGRSLYLVTPEAADNYHHWLLDLLPRLGLVRRAGYDLAAFDHVIVNHRARAYQLATLHRLGIAPGKLVHADATLLVRADTLVVPSLKASTQTLPPADIAFLRDRLLPVNPPSKGRRRIFLSRDDAAYRRLRHERAFHPLLRAHGFEIVSPGRLDVAAQAALFAEAEMVAGPAGAAFANLVFASPGTRVFEIVAPGWLTAFHWMISARLGHRHTLLLGEGAVMHDLPQAAARRSDIIVNPQSFPALLDAALAEAPAP